MQDTGHHWEAQASVWGRISAAGGFSSYAAALDGASAAFTPTDRSVRCIDERVPGGINIAGSGILLEENTLLARLRDAHADGVFSHAECGAAKLYANKAGLDPTRADEYGKEFATRIAAKLGVPYRGHLDVSPSGLHIARAAYYDGTGSFDPTRHAGLPPGFVVSRRYHDVGYALDEIRVALSIAFGDHGFGDRFSGAEPFHLVAIGRTPDETEQLISEIAPLASDTVRIDGFSAP
jgi:hypothetical protein